MILGRMLSGRQAAAGAALALVLVLAWPPPATAHDKPDVVPVVECVSDNHDGSRTARLGWHNRTGHEVTVDYGHDNNVTPGSRTHDLPRTFAPARTPPSGAFTITFSEHEVLVWRLFGRAATSASAPPCPPPQPATTAAAAAPATTTTAAPQLATAGTGSAGSATQQQPAPPPTTAPPATTAPPPSGQGTAPGQQVTSEPVAFVVVDILPSLLVGLLVLFVAATSATAWRHRGPR